MENKQAQPLLPLSEEELAKARQQKREREGWGTEKGRAMWPDIRPEDEKNPCDFSTITRDIARGS